MTVHSATQQTSKNLPSPRSLELLRALTRNPDADFRDDQWEAIDAVVHRAERVLLVQRTGWGKSGVYFISAKLLREQGSGPTVIVSPLLGLMRNQDWRPVLQNS